MLARPALVPHPALPAAPAPARSCPACDWMAASVAASSLVVAGSQASRSSRSSSTFASRQTYVALRSESKESSASKTARKKSGNAFLRGIVVMALVVAVVGGLTQVLQLPWDFAAWAFGIQWAFFLFQAWPQRSEKLYDASGSLTHLALVLAGLLSHPLRSPRQILLSVASVVWCTRLGTFLFNRISQDREDTRFTELKKEFWTFSIAWNLQVLWVFLLQLPVTLVNSSAVQPATGIWDVLGISLWSLGFLLEAVADGQKFAFRGVASNKGKFIQSGLWRYSRHPNYFGEILMWLGLSISFCSCLSGLSWQLLVWLSPAFNAFLLLFVSGVPMLEKAGEKKWGKDPEYQHYMKNTSCIIPWFPAPEGPK